MPLPQTEGRVAVVTGAGSGIGRAMVAHFVERGMSVAAADIDADAAAESAALAGGDVISMGVDVSDAAAVEALAEAAYGEWGAVHLLCNNAGVFHHGGNSMIFGGMILVLKLSKSLQEICFCHDLGVMLHCSTSSLITCVSLDPVCVLPALGLRFLRLDLL